MSDQNPNDPGATPPAPNNLPAPAPAPGAIAPKPAAPAVPKPPAKPVAKAKAAERRFFLLSIVGSWFAVAWTTMAASLGLMTLGTLRFLFPNVLTEPPSKVKVGLPETYEDGKVIEKFKDQNIWVVRNQGKLYALSTTCTHLGCTPNWLESAAKFKCPCHGSGFYISGINFEGPAPRPLERWGVSVGDDGQIVVDKSKKFQQERGEWTNPESFIAVQEALVSVGDFIRNSQIWKSIFRHPAPRDRRNRVVVMLTNVFLHLHPVSVRKSGIALSYTWCMGGLTFFLFLELTVTGVLLMFYYRPTLEHAYNDILQLRDVLTLGILRELHRWGGHAMVITIWLHMYRVFLTGSYKPPREFNWGVGVLLLVLTLLLSFTGYLLPWDQLAIWAITVGSNMARATPFLGHEGPGATFLKVGDVSLIHSGSDARFLLLGGRFVSGDTLLRFYVLHCVAIPLAVAVLIAVHFWRVRKDGGISGPL